VTSGRQARAPPQEQSSTRYTPRAPKATPPGLDEQELLDEHDATAADMEPSLRELLRLSRYCGGIAIYLRLLRHGGNPRSILNIGTGNSDLLENATGFRVGLDFKIDHLLYQRDRAIHKIVGDARQLPFRDNAFDAVTSAHF